MHRRNRICVEIPTRLALLFGLATCVSCGLDQAPQAEAQLESSNQMKELMLGIMNHRTVNDGRWPEELSEIEGLLPDRNFEQLMSNPVTGDNPGYEYVEPSDGTDPATTVILYQLRGGQRATDLRVGFADNHLSEIGSQLTIETN